MFPFPLVLAGAAVLIAAPAFAAPGAQIVKTFAAELPALAQFASPSSLCSAPLPAPAIAARPPARARQLVYVDCPAFFTRAGETPASAATPVKTVAGAR